MSKSNKKKSKAWVMPDWMEPYRPFIQNTGGNSVEELVNDNTSTLENNAVRVMLSVAVETQVKLLTALYQKGHLRL